MSNNNETLKDIVAEMRGEKGFPVPFASMRGIWLSDYHTLADRIEAAAERERNRQYDPKCDWSIKDALALANTLANHGLRDGNADAASSCIYSLCRILSSPGNAAAMREALVSLTDKVLGYLQKGLIQLPLPLEEATKKAQAALAKPARNCDGFATAYEAIKAWDGGLDTAEDIVRMVTWLLGKADDGAPMNRHVGGQVGGAQ